MTWLKKTAIVLLLLVGLPITLLGVVEILNPTTSAEDKGDATAAVMMLGLPPTALGLWLISGLRHQHRQRLEQAERDQERLFLELLQQHGGRLTTVQLASQANLSLEEAKTYLDAKALQLNGQFDVTDQGDVVYRFPV